MPSDRSPAHTSPNTNPNTSHRFSLDGLKVKPHLVTPRAGHLKLRSWVNQPPPPGHSFGEFWNTTIKRGISAGMGLLLWVITVVCTQAAIAPMAEADAAPLTCRPYHGREICIDRIKRSAKHYWEYRVNLTIDGKKQPEDLLDCRHDQRIDRDGFIEPFAREDVGRFVCRYFNHRDWR